MVVRKVYLGPETMFLSFYTVVVVVVVVVAIAELALFYFLATILISQAD